jgi:WD40 repeat protein
VAHVRGKQGRVKVWDEESGELHRDFEGHDILSSISALASFLSPDGQQPRLVVGSGRGELRVYDPEAGSVLHRLDGHTAAIKELACIASSSAAPHQPRVVSASIDGSATVWDGETGERLADLWGPGGRFSSMAVWKDYTGAHDRIATATFDGHARVWDGEAFTPLHDLQVGDAIRRVAAFQSAEGPHRLLVGLEGGPLQVWDPEEGRLLHDGINRGCPLDDCHLLESAQGRHLLAIVGDGRQHPRHPGDARRVFLDVWDLGEAPAAEGGSDAAGAQAGLRHGMAGQEACVTMP